MQRNLLHLYAGRSGESSNILPSALRFLSDWGIEPAIQDVEDGRYLEFELPTHWPRNRRWRFIAAMHELTARLRSQEVGADPTAHPCAHCRALFATCLTDCACGLRRATCTSCLGSGRIAPCGYCETVPTPQTWPVPPAASRAGHVRAFNALFRAHFNAVVGYARRCASAADVGEVHFMSAVGHLVLVAVRLHDLECTWRPVGVGAADLIPALGKDEARLRVAASALGIFMHGPRDSVAEEDRLVGALLQAAGPIVV